MFLLIVIGVLGAWHGYLWLRLVRAPQWPNGAGRLLSILLVSLAIAIPGAMIANRMIPGRLGYVLAMAGFIWMGMGFYLTVLLAGSDLLRGLAALWQYLSTHVLNTGPVSPVDPQRRVLFARLAALIAVGGAATASTWGIFLALGQRLVVRTEVVLSKLAPAHDGFVVVQLSDLHLGKTLGGDFLRAVVQQVNLLKPDLVVITGDLVDGGVAMLAQDVQVLEHLKSRHGTFFVTGNHEYYAGASDWEKHLRTLGITVLHNQVQAIRQDGQVVFDLVGIPDETARRMVGDGAAPDLHGSLAQREQPADDVPLILLAHQPKVIDQAVAEGVDLQLSGHTHGGQMWPFGALVMLDQPYLAGLHQRQQTQIYVSRGTGFWGPPIRLGAPAEISHITLRSAKPVAKAREAAV